LDGVARDPLVFVAMALTLTAVALVGCVAGAPGGQAGSADCPSRGMTRHDLALMERR